MITFRRGTSRSVLAIPDMGIVIKFAHIQIGDAWHMLRQAKRDHDRWCVVRDRQSFRCFLCSQIYVRTVEENGTLKQYLFRGIVSNWRERSYYKKSDAERRQLLQPTYLSLLGLVNVQKYGKPMKPRDLLGTTFGKLYEAFLKVVGPALKRDAHHFYYEGNFHHTGSRVVLLDYGSLATQEIVTQHGAEILRRFIPPDPRDY